MNALFWFLLVAAAAGFVYWLRSWQRREAERQRASEERLASFMAQATAAAKPGATVAAPKPADPAQRLLFEAATKAGEANEPVLSIQLYARLLSRFPDTAFASQAHAGVQAQKKKLTKA